MLTGRAVGSVAAVFVIAGLLLAVSSYAQIPDEGELGDAQGSQDVVAEAPVENAADHEDPEDYVWDSSEVIEILLNGDAITANTGAAIVEGSRVTITSGGTYSIRGVLTDGQVIVNSSDKNTVRLILDGAHIRCASSAPVIVENAKKTIIAIAEGTENYVADGRLDLADDSQADEPNAVIFSKDDLTICGAGLLTVCADVNDAISSKDGLIIAGGIIDINAVDDGIRGKDYLVVRGGTITINAAGDGLKSDNDNDPTKGYISIESGVVNIASIADAIQAATDVLIADGQIALTAGGGSRNRSGVNASAKGIKAGVSVVVDGGDIAVDSYDDAIHSDGSATINGGTLALACRDDAIHGESAVEIHAGDITVTKCYEGIEGQTVAMTDGYIRIVSSDDGIAATESVSIGYGLIDITAEGDAVSAGTDVTIVDGDIVLSAGGGSNNRTGATVSAKGIKAAGRVVIDGGDFTVDSADDAIHSDGSVTIDGGTFVLSSGDDGIHAATDLVINDGDIRIARSYEGLESADADITLNGGRIHIVSSDDGINVSAGGDNFGGGGPGQPTQPTQPTVPTQPGGRGNFMAVAEPAPTTDGTCYLYINGGYLVIHAAGDGIDSNGSIAMTAGTVLVNGPTTNMNGALDHSSFTLTGGFLLAVGSSHMAQAPSTTSTQYSILLTFNTTLSAGTLIHIQDRVGQNILTFAPAKAYSSVAFSSDKLLRGSTYDVYYGGTATGPVTDGLYEDGAYTPGALYTSFTISSMVTNVRR